jgi:hypothetical protein
MGIEQRGSPAFAEKSPTNSTTSNFLTPLDQTHQNPAHNHWVPLQGEGARIRPDACDVDAIERG